MHKYAFASCSYGKPESFFSHSGAPCDHRNILLSQIHTFPNIKTTVLHVKQLYIGFRLKTWAITQSKVWSIPRLLYWDACLHRNNNWNTKPGHVHTQSSCCEKYVTSWLNVGDLSNHPGCQWRTKHSWEPSPRPPQPRVTQYAAGSLCQCENTPSLCRTRLSQWTHPLRFSSATLNLQQIQRSLPKSACSSSEMSSSIFAKRCPFGPPEAPVPHPPSMP